MNLCYNPVACILEGKTASVSQNKATLKYIKKKILGENLENTWRKWRKIKVIEKRHQICEKKEYIEASTDSAQQEIRIKSYGCKYEKNVFTIGRENKINQFQCLRVQCMNWK